MKEQILSPLTIIICLLISAYLGGFFWVRASCYHNPGSKTFLLDGLSPAGRIGLKYYQPIFWIDEKLLGEKFTVVWMD